MQKLKNQIASIKGYNPNAPAKSPTDSPKINVT